LPLLKFQPSYIGLMMAIHSRNMSQC